jgi:hypothetical protein
MTVKDAYIFLAGEYQLIRMGPMQLSLLVASVPNAAAAAQPNSLHLYFE